MEFKRYIESFSKRHSIPLEWQELKYGYERAKLAFTDCKELETAWKLLQRPGVFKINAWKNCDGGIFEGYLLVIDYASAIEFGKKQEQEMNSINEWWNRYHNETPETKALMASGTIK